MKKDNSNTGSTLLIVIITFAIVGIISAVAISSSYTSFKIRMSGNDVTKAYYGADSAMEEVRAGLCGLLYDCVREEGGSASDNSEDYVGRVADDLVGRLRYDANSQYYNVSLGKGFASEARGNDTITVDSSSPRLTMSDGLVTVSDIEVSYTMKNGTGSSIRADIVIDCRNISDGGSSADFVYYTNYKKE